MSARLIIAVVAVAAAGCLADYPNGSGKAITTHYWDCCKPTCSWAVNAGSVNSPVKTCAADGVTTLDAQTRSGCDQDGTGFICNALQPFVENGQLYGFAAGNMNYLPSTSTCCACYKITFTNTVLAGQNMIIQLINSGSDLGNNHFDLSMPAGGAGLFPRGCVAQWPGTSSSTWGALYGGVTSRSQCDAIPSVLVAGCQFRFDAFKAADNPNVDFERVACPAALTSRSGCKRLDD